MSRFKQNKTVVLGLVLVTVTAWSALAVTCGQMGLYSLTAWAPEPPGPNCYQTRSVEDTYCTPSSIWDGCATAEVSIAQIGIWNGFTCVNWQNYMGIKAEVNITVMCNPG